MRTRYKKMSDYGISDEDSKKMLDYCQSMNTEERLRLFQCAITSAPGLEIVVYESLVTGAGYRTITKRGRNIPIKEDDFYAYRRKTLAAFCKQISKRGEKPEEKK